MNDAAREEYWDALMAGDRHRSLAAVKALLAAGSSVDEVVDELILPAQQRVGDLWLSAEWSVTMEHAATAINEGLIHWLGSLRPPPDPTAPVVVVSCLEGERHALPALVVAERVGAAGFRVQYVGGDPDADDLLRQVLSSRPRAVLLSASLTASLARQKSLVQHLAALGIPVVVGGSAFAGREARALALGATAYAPDVRAAVELLSTLPGRLPTSTPPPPSPGDLEARWLADYRAEIRHGVVRRLRETHGAGDPPPAWFAEVDEHVDQVLGCLEATLATGDETIMVELRQWLEDVVPRRGGSLAVVADLWALLAEPLRGHALARLHLAAAGPPASDLSA